MKFLLLFMFVAVGLAMEKEVSSLRQLAEGLSSAFNISLADSVECIQKSGVTREDIIYMENCVDKTESEITDMQSLRKASCTMVCAAQKQGTMIGRDVNMDEVSERLDRSGLPSDEIDKLRDSIRVCKRQVQYEEDECMVGYKLMRCMYERRS